MPEDVFRYLIASAVLLAALAFVAQAIVAIVTANRINAMQKRVGRLADEAEPILESLRSMIQENRPKISEIVTRAQEVTVLAKEQFTIIDEFLKDSTKRAKVQIGHLEGAIESTVTRAQETGAALQKTVMRPIRELNGVLAGVAAALSTLVRGQRARVDRATQDEEMFI